ncbi:MAG: response regulator transcription factor, partial [Alphaproteobacteria bacterium]|nr:response regulator transcription factor [Alphaproteobacteria bacterium]
MKILVLDQDQNHAAQVSQRLVIQGHTPTVFSDWDEALRELGFQEYSIVLLDSKFLSDVKHNILNMRRAGRGYLYVIGMDIENSKDVATLGINSVLPNSSDLNLLEKAVDTASHFILQLKKLGNEAEDFPSAGGVIAKSAFNQLLLSAIDRAG